ncbi:MAG TPA: pyridoxamine 5'-phosphate oxidase family protein [Candidatus Paceibacterota bacterium]
MEKLLEFIKNQKLLVLASHGEKDVWVANVYFGADEKGVMYFVSPENTKHSQMILKNPNVAFSIAWFDPSNHRNRKAVQGLGVCRLAENEEEIKMGVKLHNQNFPEFKERIMVEWIHNNEWGSKVWVLKPSYMKYWDDEIFGDDGSGEFSFK